MAETEFYTKMTRTSLAFIKEVGAMPFLLFQYYQTYSTAPEGIKPGLNTICADLNLKKNAVCNLKKILIEKKWIKEKNGEILILKSFRKNERCSEILNKRSEKMNESFRKNERPYKDEEEQLGRTEEEKRTTLVVPKKTPVSLSDNFEVTEKMQEWFSNNGFKCDVADETEKFKDHHLAKGSKFVDWSAAWRTWIRNSVKWAQPEKTRSAKPGGNNSTTDIFSPDYVAPKTEHSFEQVIWICYDINGAEPTRENFEVTKADFLELYPNKKQEVINYEHSELFRQRFGEKEQREFDPNFIPNGCGRIETQNQMPVSSG